MTDHQEKHEVGDDVDQGIEPEIDNDPELNDDADSRHGREEEPLPNGWVSIGPNWVVRIDGMRITTPDPALWDLDRLGDCPFVVEMTRITNRGPERVQRPLVCSRLVQACREANERFPVPAWVTETDAGLPQRLDVEQKDRGWLVVRNPLRGIVVEGVDLNEDDVEVGQGYAIGTKPWSPSAFRVEKDRAAQQMARWRRFLQAERGR